MCNGTCPSGKQFAICFQKTGLPGMQRLDLPLGRKSLSPCVMGRRQCPCVMGHVLLERSLPSTKVCLFTPDISGFRVPTILSKGVPPTAILNMPYLRGPGTTLLQPFVLTFFGDVARPAGSETNSTGTTCSAKRIAIGCGPCFLAWLYHSGVFHFA